MKTSLKKGLGFGLTSGVITTLGLIVGLNSGTHSKLVVLGGILTIAVADAFSDALGVHVSEEYENKLSHKEVWEATIATFFFKFLFALTFIIPILLLELEQAILVSLVWGFGLIATLSFVIAREAKEAAWKVIAEHMLIAILVVLITHQIGHLVARI